MHLGGTRSGTQDNDDKMMAELLRIIPEAFVFEDLGKEDVRRIAFHPNPEFKPKTYEQRILHALDGIVFVDLQESDSTPFRSLGTPVVLGMCDRPRGARWLHGNYARSSFAAGLETSAKKSTSTDDL